MQAQRGSGSSAIPGASDSGLIQDHRTRPVAARIDDTEKAKPGASKRAQLMGLIGSDINRIHRLEHVIPVPNADRPASAHADHDMSVTMLLQAGVAARLQFEITQVKRDALAEFSGQHLARGAGKFASGVRADFVGFHFDMFPAVLTAKPPQHWRLIAFGL